jgi:hypothetical protein
MLLLRQLARRQATALMLKTLRQIVVGLRNTPARWISLLLRSLIAMNLLEAPISDA